MPSKTNPEVDQLVAFPISSEMHAKVLAVLSALREAERPSHRVADLAEVVSEMTDTGLAYYFLRPLEVAGMGAISRTTAKVGIASAGRGIPMIVKRVLGSASDRELLALADFVESLLVEPSPD